MKQWNLNGEVQLEYIDPNANAEFQINAGIRIHGGASRRPDQTRKHSFRVKFRGVYDGTVEEQVDLLIKVIEKLLAEYAPAN